MQSGQTLVSVLAGTGPRWPAMADALPDGTLKDHVARLAGIRALLVVGERRRLVRRAELRNADRKIVVRLDVDEPADGGAVPPPVVTVRPLRGYQKEADRAWRLVTTLLEPATERAGRAPGRESLGGRPRVAGACAARRRADRLPSAGARQLAGHDRRHRHRVPPRRPRSGPADPLVAQARPAGAPGALPGGVGAAVQVARRPHHPGPRPRRVPARPARDGRLAGGRLGGRPRAVRGAPRAPAGRRSSHPGARRCAGPGCGGCSTTGRGSCPRWPTRRAPRTAPRGRPGPWPGPTSRGRTGGSSAVAPRSPTPLRRKTCTSCGSGARSCATRWRCSRRCSTTPRSARRSRTSRAFRTYSAGSRTRRCSGVTLRGFAQEMVADGAPAEALLAMGELMGHLQAEQQRARAEFATAFASYVRPASRRRMARLLGSGGKAAG